MARYCFVGARSALAEFGSAATEKASLEQYTAVVADAEFVCAKDK